MSALNKAYYRTFQAVFNIGARALPWRKAVVKKGAGAIEKIPSLLSELGGKKPMVVTDPGLMDVGVAPKILAVLKSRGISYSLFAKVEPNPSVHTVNAIFIQYGKDGCDSLIAIGGGSAMDAAKAAAARVVHPKKMSSSWAGCSRCVRSCHPSSLYPQQRVPAVKPPLRR